MNQDGKLLHKKAEDAREKEKFLDALQFSDQATIAYQKEGNVLGFAEVLSSRFLTLRHLFEQTQDKNFMILAKHTVMAAVEIAKNSNDPKALAIPLFNLGKAHQTLSEYDLAISTFKEAIANMIENPPKEHNRSSVITEMIIHLSVCEYKNGDKSALERAEKALIDLATSNEPDKYSKDVWMSGGYMDIAEMLKQDDQDKAKHALNRAKEIIDSNPKLTLRKKQLEKVSKEL